MLTQAALYRGTPAGGGPASKPALVAVAFAQSQLGKPYVWGGDGDSEGGFDCSDAGPLLSPGTPLLPGDLVFFGSGPHTITHVGIAISSTHMINAPYTGAVIRIDPIGPCLAATRPSQRSAT